MTSTVLINLHSRNGLPLVRILVFSLFMFCMDFEAISHPWHVSAAYAWQLKGAENVRPTRQEVMASGYVPHDEGHAEDLFDEVEGEETWVELFYHGETKEELRLFSFGKGEEIYAWISDAHLPPGQKSQYADTINRGIGDYENKENGNSDSPLIDYSAYGVPATMIDFEKMASRAEELNKQKQYYDVIKYLHGYADAIENANWSFFSNIGFAYARVNEWELADKYLQKAYSLKVNPETVINYAISRYRLKDMKKSCVLAKKYLKQGGTNKEIAEKILSECQ